MFLISSNGRDVITHLGTNLHINLRGGHGTGKTTVSHRLIGEHKHDELVEPEYCQGKHFSKPNCFRVEGDPPVHVVGRYQSGMDGIFPQTIIEEMLEHWAPQGHVLWENVMVSANIGRWAELARKLKSMGVHPIWVFFDTPLETCIERVFARRREASARGFSHRQADSEVKLDVLSGHWRRTRRAGARAWKEGIDVRWVDHRLSYEQVHNLLIHEGGWSPPEGLFSNVPYLERWKPTDDEVEYLLKTARLPWEPEDTIVKVAYTPKPKNDGPPGTVLGTSVKKWGGESWNVLGVTVRDWNETVKAKIQRVETA